MIVKFYSYLYHLVLVLFLLGFSLVAFLNGMHNLRLDMLPWTGSALTWWLLYLGLAGLIIIGLAVMRILRVLFLLWTVAVLALMIRGFFFSSYLFDGWTGFKWALLYVVGALLAVVGGWLQFREAPVRR